MEDEAITLSLHIDSSEYLSEDQQIRLTQNLRSELLDTGVESVNFARSGSAPAGAMSPDAFTLGTLAIAVLPTVLPVLIEFLKEWKLCHASDTITIKRQIGDQSVEATFLASLPPEELSKRLDVLSQQLLKGKKTKY